MCCKKRNSGSLAIPEYVPPPPLIIDQLDTDDSDFRMRLICTLGWALSITLIIFILKSNQVG